VTVVCGAAALAACGVRGHAELRLSVSEGVGQWQPLRTPDPTLAKSPTLGLSTSKISGLGGGILARAACFEQARGKRCCCGSDWVGGRVQASKHVSPVAHSVHH